MVPGLGSPNWSPVSALLKVLEFRQCLTQLVRDTGLYHSSSSMKNAIRNCKYASMDGMELHDDVFMNFIKEFRTTPTVRVFSYYSNPLKCLRHVPRFTQY